MHGSFWLTPSPDPSSPSQTNKTRPYLSRAVLKICQNTSPLLHAYPLTTILLFCAFPFPFSLSSSRTCPATAKLVIGCLDFWLAFENWATRTKVMIERRKYRKDVRCCCVAKAAGRERSSDHYRRVLTRDGSPADDRFTDRWWPGWW